MRAVGASPPEGSDMLGRRTGPCDGGRPCSSQRSSLRSSVRMMISRVERSSASAEAERSPPSSRATSRNIVGRWSRTELHLRLPHRRMRSARASPKASALGPSTLRTGSWTSAKTPPTTTTTSDPVAAPYPTTPPAGPYSATRRATCCQSGEPLPKSSAIPMHTPTSAVSDSRGGFCS